jgi:hypothetical protein
VRRAADAHQDFAVEILGWQRASAETEHREVILGRVWTRRSPS